MSKLSLLTQTILVITLPSFSASFEVNSGLNIILRDTHYPGILAEVLTTIGTAKAEFVTGIGITQVSGKTESGPNWSCTHDDNHFFRVLVGANGLLANNFYIGPRVNADFEFDKDKCISFDGILGNKIQLRNRRLFLNVAGSIGHGFYYQHQDGMRKGYPKIRIIIGLGLKLKNV